MFLYVSGFGKFNRHHFEYKEEVEDVILVKDMVVLEWGHFPSLSDAYTRYPNLS